MQSNRWWHGKRSPSVRHVIAFLGLGRMGARMAQRLVAAGRAVTVWNRTPREIPGAATASSPAEAVAGADVVVTMLSDPDAVLEVVRAALPGLRPGTTLIEMSTIGPDAVVRVRALLPAGVALVDAPVLGSVQPAAEGTLQILAGGSPEDLDRVEDVLAVFGRVRRVGGPGAGAAMKLAVMSALVPAQVMLAENLAYAAALGVDRAAYLDVLATTPLGPLVERLRPVVESGPPETRYALGLAAKDLRLATEHPGRMQTIAAAARDRLTAASAAGLADRDLTAIIGAVGGSGPGTPVLKINPPSVPPTNGRYCHAVRYGDLLFVSGQVALDENGEVVGPGDMTRQSEYVMENLGRILADQGSSYDRILHIRTFLTDMDRLPEYAAVRARHIPKDPPASTTVEVPRLFRPGLLIEVEVVAAVS
ncbi:NAD(P)-binding domain-containing protein [Thermobispora bispora]|uniref:NAD(P)-binding domain-containing protein n=1 Tax=Thermobispora bispora TaxID=2006 RepID=UPI001F11D0FE|nr:NAD(P)-binding domain-containing protein [Thermobispora bispora]